MAEGALREMGFSDRILSPSSAEFAPASLRANAAAECKAALIAFPASTEAVSLAIRFAARSKLEIAVKCGGHHYSSASSIENGLVIDMGALKSVSIDKAAMKVTIGGGCLWGDVYTALRDKRLVCVGGGVHVVGVGGHITGGGYGPLSFKYGMACDNVIEATVVVADGRILRASEIENSDLFFAIRGGSSSFGVVTEFVLKIYPDQGPYFFKSVGFTADARVKVFSELRSFLARIPVERQILVFLNFVRGPPPHSEALIILNFFGLGAVEDFEDVFEPFLKAGTQFLNHTTHCPSLVEFSHVIDDLLLQGAPRKANGGAPITSLWPGMAEEVWDRWMSYTDANPDARQTKVFLEFHNSKRQRPETTCIPVDVPRHGMCVSSEEHHDPAGDQRAEQWTHEMNNAVRSYEKRYGARDLGVNGNASMLIEKSEDVWGQHYFRLRRIKAKYDPTYVFKRYFPIVLDLDGASASL
ncbi:hypothetical protein LTR84_009585 [Exophiala bonariae]|uniref:FAD-binding PCMH-type domain-containing protein n=1 Tax=Exophiala bonariae TaxID=1690606 RepID=A0AAV9NIQ7_9EURO|nr:hypothetical protein LTR84_009585 [Exophiala bonariae]